MHHCWWALRLFSLSLATVTINNAEIYLGLWVTQWPKWFLQFLKHRYALTCFPAEVSLYSSPCTMLPLGGACPDHSVQRNPSLCQHCLSPSRVSALGISRVLFVPHTLPRLSATRAGTVPGTYWMPALSRPRCSELKQRWDGQSSGLQNNLKVYKGVFEKRSNYKTLNCHK